jgi:hypothetical protein
MEIETGLGLTDQTDHRGGKAGHEECTKKHSFFVKGARKG